MSEIVNHQQRFALSVQEAFDALERISTDPEAVKAMASQPVSLRDTPRFNLPVDIISRAEISNMRQKLASAISSEKWLDGFMFAMKLLMMVTAI